MTDAIVAFLEAHPWAPYVYVTAMLLAVALRAGYPETEIRPRWVVMLLAVVDLLHLSPSSPVKMLVNKRQTGSVTRTLPKP